MKKRDKGTMQTAQVITCATAYRDGVLPDCVVKVIIYDDKRPIARTVAAQAGWINTAKDGWLCPWCFAHRNDPVEPEISESRTATDAEFADAAAAAVERNKAALSQLADIPEPTRSALVHGLADPTREDGQ